MLTEYELLDRYLEGVVPTQDELTQVINTPGIDPGVRRALLRIFLGKSDKSANFGPGIGCFHEGNTLIVAEQAADLDKNYPLAGGGGCSLWLNRQLTIFEHDFYWINAKNSSGWEDASFLSSLKPGRIIALGNVAKQWCENNNLKYEHTYHPQYWKRFRSKERYPLLDMLK